MRTSLRSFLALAALFALLAVGTGCSKSVTPESGDPSSVEETAASAAVSGETGEPLVAEFPKDDDGDDQSDAYASDEDKVDIVPSVEDKDEPKPQGTKSDPAPTE